MLRLESRLSLPGHPDARATSKEAKRVSAAGQVFSLRVRSPYSKKWHGYVSLGQTRPVSALPKAREESKSGFRVGAGKPPLDLPTKDLAEVPRETRTYIEGCEPCNPLSDSWSGDLFRWVRGHVWTDAGRVCIQFFENEHGWLLVGFWVNEALIVEDDDDDWPAI